MSSATATLIGWALLLGFVVLGFAVGPKWWNWGSFLVLSIVLIIPLAIMLFLPFPLLILLNVVISHAVWLKRHGETPVRTVAASR
jgi:hypothetical protein